MAGSPRRMTHGFSGCVSRLSCWTMPLRASGSCPFLRLIRLVIGGSATISAHRRAPQMSGYGAATAAGRRSPASSRRCPTCSQRHEHQSRMFFECPEGLVADDVIVGARILGGEDGERGVL